MDADVAINDLEGLEGDGLGILVDCVAPKLPELPNFLLLPIVGEVELCTKVWEALGLGDPEDSVRSKSIFPCLLRMSKHWSKPDPAR